MIVAFRMTPETHSLVIAHQLDNCGESQKLNIRGVYTTEGVSSMLNTNCLDGKTLKREP